MSMIRNSETLLSISIKFISDLKDLKRLDIDGKLDKEISIRESIEKEIKDLKERVSVLQGRIQDLEKRLKTFS